MSPLTSNQLIISVIIEASPRENEKKNSNKMEPPKLFIIGELLESFTEDFPTYLDVLRHYKFLEKLYSLEKTKVQPKIVNEIVEKLTNLWNYHKIPTMSSVFNIVKKTILLYNNLLKYKSKHENNETWIDNKIEENSLRNIVDIAKYRDFVNVESKEEISLSK